MAEFDLDDLEKIASKQEIIDYLVDKNIIKEKKFLNQLEYEKEIDRLKVRMLELQSHIIEAKKRVLIIFEGRDAAGKGGTISRTIEYMNPKKYHVVSLPKPTEAETGQWYFQRYFSKLPNEGEIVFFDRSWYNRAVVEPVFDFCTDDQHEVFLNQVNEVEKLLQEDGIILIKIFLDISKKEQADRLQERKDDPLKQWKLGSLDQQAQELWDKYTHYIDKMFERTSGIPWNIITTDDKKEARIEALKVIVNTLHEKADEKLDSKITKTTT